MSRIMYRIVVVAFFFTSLSGASAQTDPGSIVGSIADQRDIQCPKQPAPDACRAEYNELIDLALKYNAYAQIAKEAEAHGDTRSMYAAQEKSVEFLEVATDRFATLSAKYGQPD